jgi:hypothetical protein
VMAQHEVVGDLPIVGPAGSGCPLIASSS